MSSTSCGRLILKSLPSAWCSIASPLSIVFSETSAYIWLRAKASVLWYHGVSLTLQSPQQQNRLLFLLSWQSCWPPHLPVWLRAKALELCYHSVSLEQNITPKVLSVAWSLLLSLMLSLVLTSVIGRSLKHYRPELKANWTANLTLSYLTSLNKWCSVYVTWICPCFVRYCFSKCLFDYSNITVILPQCPCCFCISKRL